MMCYGELQGGTGLRPQRCRRGAWPVLLAAALACLPAAPALAATVAPHDNPFLNEQAAAALLPKLPKLPESDHHGRLPPPLPGGPTVPTDVRVDLVAINGRAVLLSVTENGRPQLRRVADGSAFFIKGQQYQLRINGLNVRISRHKDIVWDLDLQGPPEAQR